MTDQSPNADARGVVDLRTAGEELLDQARAGTTGRAGRTLIPGAGAGDGAEADLARPDRRYHESPGAATLQTMTGRVRLTTAAGGIELRPGEVAAIPETRHGVNALEDAVLLLSVAQSEAG